jgi:hypothetical protein
MYPSMRIKPLPLSASFAGQLKTVVFFLSDDNSKASPLETFRRSATDGSIRAIFLPTSRCSATSAILRVTSLADSLGLLLSRSLSLLSLLRLSEDIVILVLTSTLSYLKIDYYSKIDNKEAAVFKDRELLTIDNFARQIFFTLESYRVHFVRRHF